MLLKRRLFRLLSTPLLIGILTLAFNIQPVKSEPETWTVDDNGPADFHTIQDAINAATPGDTIYVRNGTYHEHLVVNKTVFLTGQNPHTTVIDGDGTDTIIYIAADNVNISNLTIRNGDVGIHLHCSGNSSIKGNRIINNYLDGVRVSSSDNVTIKDNIMDKNSQHAILLQDSDNNILCNNTLSSYTRMSVGIFLHSSNNNTLSHNTVTGSAPKGNEGGIGLLYSNNNTISGNIIANNNWCGISLRRSNSNIISGNTITEHNWFGMMLRFSYHNNIYHNNFINNTYQVSIESSNNTWDLAGCGNYWINYNGFDNDHDGIGDTLYQINTANIDNFPLMGFLSNLAATKEGKTFQILTISNSTISDFIFMVYLDQKIGENVSMLRYNVIGKDGTFGFCRITIPHDLLQGPYVVTVDDLPPKLMKEIMSNITHTTLYFTYIHTSRQVAIVPDFSLTLFFTLFIILSAVATIFKILNSQPN